MMKNSASRYSMRTCSLSQKNQVVTDDLKGFAEKWQIQNVFSKISTDPAFTSDKEKKKIACKELPRIKHCLRTPYGGDINLMRSQGASIGHYQHLQTCGCAYGCPLCSPRISEYRAAEINEACIKWMEESEDRSMLMVTYTIPHYIFQRFEKVRRSFMKMKGNFKNQNPLKDAPFVPYKKLKKNFKIKHDVTAMDFTFSGRNGWHVHSHDLYFLDMAINKKQIAALQEEMIKGWIYQTTKPSCNMTIDDNTAEYMKLHSVKVQLAKTPADYIAKFGVAVFEKNRDMFTGGWNAAQEITKSHLKVGKQNSLTPWDFARIILSCPNDRNVYLYFGRLLYEFTTNLKGKQMVYWSTNSKKYFGLADVKDADIVKIDDAYAELVMNLTKQDWQIIKKYDARAEVAILAGSQDALYIKNWIYSLCQN